MRRILMAVLAVAVLANVVLVLDALTFGALVPPAGAQSLPPVDTATSEGSEQPLHPADAGPQTEKETYRRLVDELVTQRDRLEQRARELLERERQLSVLRDELKTERDQIEAARQELVKEKEDYLSLGRPNFDRLLKAYEGMDPENAAAALAELYGKDRKVVIDVLLGLKARQAAQTLDALAAIKPKIAADISFQIWSQDPKIKR